MSVRSTTASAGRRPQLSTQEATELARTLYGLHATARPLPGYCDQNVLLTADDGAAFVLKIAHAEEERDVLEAQHALLKRLGPSSVPVPGVCSTQDGETITSLAGTQGSRHLVRMLTYLPGTPLARVHPHPRALLEDLGRCLGQMSVALDEFDHPALHRHLTWDLQHALETIHTDLDTVNDPQRRALVARYLAAFERDTTLLLATLRRSIIHGDANDYNVLVSPADRPERAVVGVIDFGDAVYSYTVAEVAIAAAYAMLGKQDPVAAAAAIAAGYHTVYPLTEHEVEALFPLITIRLCMSVCMAAVQKARDPDNEYLAVSEQPAWDLLERLVAVPPRLAHYRLRHACGWPPCPQAAAITGWLQAHRSQAAPVVRPDPHDAPVVVFDFSVGSTEWSQAGLMQPLMAGETIAARMQAAEAAIGVGRYDEARLVYAADQFAGEGGERRTIHIGLDLFQEAGAPVFAPFDAVIHSIADNDRPLDYGPTIILQHEPGDGPVFFTLYGHLSRASLDGLAAGQPIRKGQQIGALGTPAENGGWAPHLHLQVIADMLGYAGDFPGVAPPSQRAVWTNLCPDPNLLLGIPATAFPAPKQTANQILKARRRHFGKNFGLSYQVPLHIVRGFRQHLYDAEGRSYLDGVNNVCHVGHSHPRVVEALARQAAVLNTNTRYLHENLVRYAERLTATLPEPLRVCFFVNSGSEANDLALRLAYAHTGRRDVIVLDGAYHGHLSSLIGISPYKFDGPGGSGRPPHTHVVPMPDSYRGRYRRDDPEAGAKYAAHVREAVEQSGGVAAWLAESLLSCGGQIVLPQGFLAEAYRHVRAGGGVCIADEVQVGLGRVGTHMWGFETQGVVPDVVTMGKPLGNGHPLAAVVTTDEIAASFATGMEYFNTFGGNPVSCAVGLAVLEVMQEERLQAHALRIGTYLMDGLAGLMERHPIIGDVRGSGLFIGVELVRDRKTLEPAATQAAYLVNRAREHGVLLSTDGPLHNVIKIKPPLVFDEADAARVIDTLDGILAEDFCRQQDA